MFLGIRRSVKKGVRDDASRLTCRRRPEEASADLEPAEASADLHGEVEADIADPAVRDVPELPIESDSNGTSSESSSDSGWELIRQSQQWPSLAHPAAGPRVCVLDHEQSLELAKDSTARIIIVDAYIIRKRRLCTCPTCLRARLGIKRIRA